MAKGFKPIVSNNLPANGPSRPIIREPGNNNNPESNAEKPRKFCK